MIPGFSRCVEFCKVATIGVGIVSLGYSGPHSPGEKCQEQPHPHEYAASVSQATSAGVSVLMTSMA